MIQLERKLDKVYDKMGYAHQTRYSYTKNIMLFLDWCEQESIDPTKTGIDDLYTYVGHLRARDLSEHTVRQLVKSLRHYYDAIGYKENPVLFIRTGKKVVTMPKDLLDEETMLDMYLFYQPRTLSDRRNKVILGMVIFQGITRQEIGLLEVEHVELDKERIYIPATRSSNERYIPLRRAQIPDLEDYLYKVREQLLIEAQKKTERLFFTVGIGNRIHNALYLMTKRLRLYYPQFKSFSQVRNSRIAIWLNSQKKDLRKVQYLSGMRYASSLLRHKKTTTEQLKKKLDIIHPMDRF